MRVSPAWVGVGLAVLLAPMLLVAAPPNDCGGLAQLNAGWEINSATPVAAGTMAPRGRGRGALKGWAMPAYCQVRGTMHERTGADGHRYGIHFELRLPSRWNGELFFQGGGGLDGVVQPAIGVVSGSSRPALARGYAVVSTDSGHTGAANSEFGHEQQARLDFGYAFIGAVTRAAKVLVKAFYGRAPAHTYFVGCSNGGREAMMAVQRYPLMFDGAIAGDPGFHLTRAAVAEAWDTEAFDAVAPRDSAGRPILSEAFSPADLALVDKSVLAKCDGLDGLRDGEINNFRACHYAPAVLVCRGEKTATCLTRAQVSALKRVFGGAHTSGAGAGPGEPLYSGWYYDAGLGTMGWRIWKLGTSTGGVANALNTTLGAMALKDYFVHPYIPDFDPAHVDFDTIASKVAATAVINDATSTDLGTFAARGGKLIIYEGLSDPVFSAEDLVNYYTRFMKDNGGEQKAQSISRLFLVPGMNHCGGGPATDDFDSLTALNDWVVNGQAPQRMVATGRSFPGRTRPLCPYPEYAAYSSGNPQDASSFVCQ